MLYYCQNPKKWLIDRNFPCAVAIAYVDFAMKALGYRIVYWLWPGSNLVSNC